MSSQCLERYRIKYGHYNDETLDKATIQDPSWLKDIILDKDIEGFARSFALYALAQGARDEYFEFIKLHATDPSPFMREACFMGLFRYNCHDSAKYPNLKMFFEENLSKETGVGVRKKIETLLSNWDFWTDFDKEE